jgi:molecular chaperone HtpG
VNAPSAIAASEDMLTPHMHRLMVEAGQQVPKFQPVLELNPSHAIVKRLLSEQSDDRFNMTAGVLLDQALLSEGGTVADPNKFIIDMNALIG